MDDDGRTWRRAADARECTYLFGKRTVLQVGVHGRRHMQCMHVRGGRVRWKGKVRGKTPRLGGTRRDERRRASPGCCSCHAGRWKADGGRSMLQAMSRGVHLHSSSCPWSLHCTCTVARNRAAAHAARAGVEQREAAQSQSSWRVDGDGEVQEACRSSTRARVVDTCGRSVGSGQSLEGIGKGERIAAGRQGAPQEQRQSRKQKQIRRETRFPPAGM